MNALQKKLLIFVASVLTIFFVAGQSSAYQQTACYGEQGGVKQVAESGCEYEYQSGATVDIQAGVTETHANDPVFSGDPTFSGDPVFSGSPSISGDITANSLVVTTTSDLKGNVSDSGGVFTIADNAAVTGQADAIQLTVTGYTTQTNDIFVVEASGGTDFVTVDGNGDVDIPNTLNLKGDAFPLLTGADDVRWACGTSSFTGTASIATGLTTATHVIPSMVTDPSADVGAPFKVTHTTPTTSSFTASAWQDDATVATSTVTIQWCALGVD